MKQKCDSNSIPICSLNLNQKLLNTKPVVVSPRRKQPSADTCPFAKYTKKQKNYLRKMGLKESKIDFLIPRNIKEFNRYIKLTLKIFGTKTPPPRYFWEFLAEAKTTLLKDRDLTSPAD